MPKDNAILTTSELKEMSDNIDFERDFGNYYKGVVTLKFVDTKKSGDGATKLELLQYIFRKEMERVGFELEPKTELAGDVEGNYSQISVVINGYSDQKLAQLKQNLAEIPQEKIDTLYKALTGFVPIDINNYKSVDFSDGDLLMLAEIQKAGRGLKPSDLSNPLELADAISLLAEKGDLAETLQSMENKAEAIEISSGMDQLLKELNRKRLSKGR